ncbi:MAG: PDZ domain-containing protein [Deltaproteobacteria bacterium]|nr:PDZ domain-containing protein [Deltaproteobacteria bacterium]
MRDLTPRIAQALRYEGPGRVYVSMCFDGSPAHEAGIREGDVIEEVGQHRIAAVDAYKSVILGFTAGNPVRFTLNRKGQSLETVVTPTGFPKSMVEPYAWTLLGVKARPATKSDARKLGLARDGGMIVSKLRPSGPAAEAGLRPGDVILEIGNIAVTSADEFSIAVAALRLKSSTVVLVQRGPYGVYVSLPLP